MTEQAPPSLGPVRTGQMTAVMRAVAPTGPKVLRIGLVQSGRVIEERIVKQRTHVTIGPHERNLFVLRSGLVPASFRLFEIIGGEYYLNFLDSMSGRVALPTGIVDLATIKSQARRGAQDAYQLRLTDDSRGKVTVGDITFLFQFVAPPPLQPKPQLPVSVMRGSMSMDWPTTIIAALSFLLHFMAIGAIYSDWLDPVEDYDVNVSNLVESMKALPPPPPVEVTETPTETTEAKEEAPKAKAEASGKKGPMSAAQAAALSHELDALEMATIGALAGMGPATEGVLRSGEVPTGALDQAAASSSGVGIGGLQLGGGGGTIRPGEAGGGLGSIGTTQGGGGGGEVGKVAKVAGPKGNAAVGGAAVSGGEVSNAARVVAAMRAGFRACYNRALANNPDAEGKINLSIHVGPGGEVTAVNATPSGNLGADVVGCVTSRAQAARFDPPQGGMAVIQVPVTFVKQ